MHTGYMPYAHTIGIILKKIKNKPKKIYSDGPDQFRHGKIAKKATRQCESRQGWDYPAVEAKPINANDDVYSLAA